MEDTHFGVALRMGVLCLIALIATLVLNRHGQLQADEAFPHSIGNVIDSTATPSAAVDKPTFRTSFDCARTRPGSQDAVICHDRSLASKDVEIGRLVGEVRALPNVDQKQFSNALDNVWKVRADCQTDLPCLTLWYDATIDALHKKIDGR